MYITIEDICFSIFTKYFLILDICLLMLVLNAAKWSATIIPLLEPHTLRHYYYLRDTMPSFVPVLDLSDSNSPTFTRPLSVPQSYEFLNNVISNLDITQSMTS